MNEARMPSSSIWRMRSLPVPSRRRASIGPMAARLSGLGQDVVVRVNAGWLDLFADLDVAVAQGISALMLPKIEDAARLQVVSDIVGELEVQRGLPPGGIKLIALVESPIGLEQLPAIASAPRVSALALGPEDFALALGVPPTPDVLDLPCRMIALAAASHGLAAIGVPMSLASFDNPEAYGTAARRARGMGISGALCIHPVQVHPVNQAFAPSPDEIAEAVAIWDAWCKSGKRGVVKLGRKMIDAPLALRAQRVLESTRRDEDTGSQASN